MSGTPEEGSGTGVDWDRLFAISVHPTRVEILEAMEWLDLPLSPVQMTAILGKHRKGVGHVGYHMRRLTDDGFLYLKSTRPVRGATEHFYLLSARPER
jgi:hypothetical protein